MLAIVKEAVSLVITNLPNKDDSTWPACGSLSEIFKEAIDSSLGANMNTSTFSSSCRNYQIATSDVI
jgi:hypothetical protein